METDFFMPNLGKFQQRKYLFWWNCRILWQVMLRLAKSICKPFLDKCQQVCALWCPRPLTAPQLSHQTVAEGQSGHMDFTRGDTKDSVVLPLKTLYFQKQLHWNFSELNWTWLEVVTSTHPKPAAPHLSRASASLSNHSFELFIKMRPSRRLCLILFSTKTVLKSKARKNFEKRR